MAFNIPSLENTKTNISNELTYATSSNNSKIFGVPWNKLTDKLSISLTKFQQTVTKRNISSYVALICDLLSIVSFCHVLGKVIYSEPCDEKIPWDVETPEDLKNKFVKWVRDIEFKKLNTKVSGSK